MNLKYVAVITMSVCTFFGHKDTPNKIEPLLRAALIDLIEKQRVSLFYVGNQGSFDRMVRKVLRELKALYPQIDYAVVLAYLPEKPNPQEDYSDTIYPLEGVPPKFAIDRRNHWMIDHSDFVVSYVWKPWGGAAKFKGIAEKKGLQVLNLAM
ncbi:MAG: hypothetical protein IJC46_03225 [Clostridia bacterium]|nr:hypothetical protein [Clostridia bacterium]